MVFKVGLSTTVLQNKKPNQSVDGIGVYTKKLQYFLEREGCEIEELSFPRRFLTLKSKSLVELPYSVLSSLAVATNGFSRPKMSNADVFHATDYRILPMKIPVVATLHDAIPMKSPTMANSKLRSLKNYLMRSVAQFADQVVTVSHYAIAELEEYYRIPRHRIQVIYNGVDRPWFDLADRVVLNNILKNRFLSPGYILTVGTLQPRKNIDLLIDAYLSLPSSIRRERQLVIIGKQGWQCQDLVKRLQNNSDKGVVWLNDVVSEGELRYLYSGSDLFVFPSLFEGFGLPLLEAFARKTPVLASSNTSLPEVGGHAAEYFDPYSKDELRSKIIDLLASESHREKLIEMGYVRSKEFTWEKTAQNMLKVYKSLV